MYNIYDLYWIHKIMYDPQANTEVNILQCLWVYNKCITETCIRRMAVQTNSISIVQLISHYITLSSSDVEKTTLWLRPAVSEICIYKQLGFNLINMLHDLKRPNNIPFLHIIFNLISTNWKTGKKCAFKLYPN